MGKAKNEMNGKMCWDRIGVVGVVHCIGVKECHLFFLNIVLSRFKLCFVITIFTGVREQDVRAF